MAERYESDEYSFEEYSDESINIGCACSWSVSDYAQHRPVVNINLDEVWFNSESSSISDEKLYKVMDKLQQAATGDPMVRVAKAGRRIACSVPRDYYQESHWRMLPPLSPPRRFGETIELVREPSGRRFIRVPNDVTHFSSTKVTT